MREAESRRIADRRSGRAEGHRDSRALPFVSLNRSRDLMRDRPWAPEVIGGAEHRVLVNLYLVTPVANDHDAEGRPDREAPLALTLLDPVNANAPAKLRPALTWLAEQAA